MQHFVPATADISATATATATVRADGVRSRRLSAGDVSLFGAHLRRLDPETRRLRFGVPVNDAFLDRYAASTLATGAYLRGLFVEDTLRGVAELHADASGVVAEGAFSLEAPFQGRRFGTRLFGSLLDAARNRGIQKLVLNCLRENVRMQRIARRNGADIAVDRGAVVAEILRPHPDAGTLAREWSEDVQTLFGADLVPAPRPLVDA